MSLFDVGRLSEMPRDSMKRIEAGGKEILLVNINGKIYAVDNRCGHMNAPLSRGTLEDDVVECPLHHARFDVITGKTLTAGHLGGLSGAVISRTKTGGIMDDIKTHDLGTYEVVIDEDLIKIRID